MMKTKIIELIVIALAFLIVGFIGGVQFSATRHTQTQIDILGHTLTEIDISSISTESVMSAYEAEMFIDEAIYAHDYYIKNPELQNKGTGDTDFNAKTIKQYQRLRKLVEIFSK